MQTEIDGEMEMIDIANHLVVIPKAVFDIFLKRSDPADLIALYVFYYYTAKWQKTNRIRATTGYCATGLHWGEERVRKAKKQLIELDLVHDVRTIDKESRKAKGWYIQITYIMKNENVVNHLKTTLPPLPDGGSSHKVESEYTNALSNSTLNALSNSTLNMDIYNYWNSKQSLVNHRKYPNSLDAILKNFPYTKDQIFKAIDNYSKFRDNPKNYSWTYEWNLVQFLQRGKKEISGCAHFITDSWEEKFKVKEFFNKPSQPKQEEKLSTEWSGAKK